MLMAISLPAIRTTRPYGTLLLTALLALPVVLGLVWPAAAAGPPPQPKTGPGGADYDVKDVVKKAYGEGSAQAFVFRPGGAATQPRPVIVFLHMPGAISPKYYGGWINHLVRKGNIVIYPRFEEDGGKTRFALMSGEAVKGVKEALAGLEADPDARPDLTKVAIVGHSGGALIAVNVAAAAPENDLPKPRLVFGAMPMRSSTADKRKGVVINDLAGLDPQTVVVMLVGDRDSLAAEAGGREVIRATKGLAPERRLLIKVGSDSRGQPPLTAGHFVPMALDPAYDFPAIAGALTPPKVTAAVAPPKDKEAREAARIAASEAWWTGYEENRLRVNYEQMTGADAMDWLGIWRPFDIVRDTVFSGGDAKAVARNNSLYDMGLWSDGLPVRRLNAESPRPDKEQPPPEAAPKQAKPKRQL
jgi:hypothetical protein